jgi:hypothetical protein
VIGAVIGAIAFVSLPQEPLVLLLIGASLLACIPVLASIPLGTWLRGRVSARGFDLAVVAMLTASIGVLGVKAVG